jgi:hypothetical protein
MALHAELVFELERFRIQKASGTEHQPESVHPGQNPVAVDRPHLEDLLRRRLSNCSDGQGQLGL